MERTEPPSSSRLQELREQGIVPYSSFASRTAGSLAVLISLMILAPQFAALFKTLLEVIQAGDPHPLLSTKDQKPAQLMHAALVILAVPASAALLGAFAAGLFQTRFLFRMARVSPVLDRINPFRVSIKGFFVRIAFLGTSAFLSFLFSVVLVRLVIREVFGLVHRDAGLIPSWLAPFFEGLLPIFVVVLSFSGFAALLISRRRFAEAHKMTRAEIAQEGDRA